MIEPDLLFDTDSAHHQPMRAALAGWAAKPVSERLGVIKRVRRLIAEHGTDLAAASASTRNRPLGESLTAEVIPLAEACRFLEREAVRVLAPRSMGRCGRPLWLSGITSEIRREPHGIVLVIGPSNYPLFLPGVQALQAITAGNAVLLKPAEGTRKIAQDLAELLRQAGLDPTLLQVLPEDPQSARAAIAHGVDKVILTGSATTGAKVLADLAPRLVPAAMELSGCDAVFVRADADLDLVSRALVFGLCLNAGATCIAPRRVFVPHALSAQLENWLTKKFARASEITVAPALAARLHPLLKEAFAKGARMVIGSAHADGSVTTPLVLAGTHPDSGLLREDIFAPVLSLVSVASDKEALAANARCPYALGASVFSRDLRAAQALAARIRAGMVVVNDLIAPTADARLPFGGRGQSGFGVTRGAEGLLEMTVPKVVIVNRSRLRLHFDETTPHDAEIFTAYLELAHGAGLAPRGWALARMIRAVRRRHKSRGAAA